jgi:hypothetical protein
MAGGLTLLMAITASCGESPKSSHEAAAGSQSAPTAALLGAPAVANRKVVYTADLVVRVSSSGKTSEEAVAEVKRAGGFVFAQDADADSRATELTLKVPADAFDGLVDAIGRLGKVLRRTVKAQDVTAEVVDVEGRLKTAQTSAERLRTLLADAKSAPDIVAVEGELAKREADIESLQGRLRVLTDQVELATVTVRLTERNDLQVSDDLPGFLGGLRAGTVALANVGLASMVVAGFLVPFLPLAAAAVWLVRRYRRRHPKSYPGPPGGWPQPPPGAPPAPHDPPVAQGSAPEPPRTATEH